ncbi:hypothetical protein EON76_04475 [bacterium]|nr:MAG: hypothetical protein EON76_04475 [bacterium]
MLFQDAQAKAEALEIALVTARISCKAADKDRGLIAMGLIDAFYQNLAMRFPEVGADITTARQLEMLIARNEWAELMMYSQSEAIERRNDRLWVFSQVVALIVGVDDSFDLIHAEFDRFSDLKSEYEYIESMYLVRRTVFDTAAKLMAAAKSPQGCKDLKSKAFDNAIARLDELTQAKV